MPKLEILTGQHAQHQFLIESDLVWIGSDASCDICLREAGISKRHARIVRGEDDVLWVEDAGGSFGTLLNGKSIEKAPLSSGDELTLGRIKIRFVEEKTVFATTPFLEDSFSFPSSAINDIDESSLDFLPSDRTNVTPASQREAFVPANEDCSEPTHSKIQTSLALEDVHEIDSIDLFCNWEQKTPLSLDDEEEHEEEVLSLDLEDMLLGEEDMLAEEEVLDLSVEALEEAILYVKTTEAKEEEKADSPDAILTAKSFPKAKSRPRYVRERHTLTRIRPKEASQQAEESLESEVKEVTSATRNRADLFQAEIERLKKLLEERERSIIGLDQASGKEQGDQQQTSLLEATLALYREDNERLKVQLGVYEEAAAENEKLLKKLLLFTQEIEDLSNENKMLKQRLLQYRRLLMQHGLLRKRTDEVSRQENSNQ